MIVCKKKTIEDRPSFPLYRKIDIQHLIIVQHVLLEKRKENLLIYHLEGHFDFKFQVRFGDLAGKSNSWHVIYGHNLFHSGLDF